MHRPLDRCRHGGSSFVHRRGDYRVVAAALLALAVLTGVTGARTAIIWFKICPVLLAGSATLLLLASFS